MCPSLSQSSVFSFKEKTGSALQRSRDTPSVALTTSDGIRDDVSTVSAADDNQVIAIHNLGVFLFNFAFGIYRIENNIQNFNT